MEKTTVTNMLYNYHSAISSIKSLVEDGHNNAAISELVKLQDDVMFDYITALADEADELPDFPDDVDESNYNPYMGCDEYDCIDIDSWGEY